MEGEGSKLLESDDGNILDAALCALSFEIVVDLTAAHNNLGDLCIWYKISGWVLKDALESETTLKGFDLGRGAAELQEFLGDRDYQWLAERSSNLATQKMEVLRGSCAIA